MQLTRAQKETKLAKAAEAAIKQLLDWDKKNPQPNLTQIEEAVLALRARLGQAMAEVVLAGSATTGRSTALSNLQRADALQGAQGQSAGEPSWRTGDGARVLLLRPL